MKEILKMIRFDYITVKSFTVPYVIGFIVISFVLSLFGIPLGILSFVALMAIFGPVQELANSDTRRIYGVLPVRRDAVTRAAFMEIIVPLFVGELLSLVLLLISNSSKLYRIFPKTVGDIIEGLFDFSQNDLMIAFGELCIILILISASLCILAAYLEMKSEIQGHENDIRDLLTVIFIIVVVIEVITALVNMEIIPPVKRWLIPRTVLGKWVFAVFLNIIAVSVSVLFCENAVKKTADYEI